MNIQIKDVNFISNIDNKQFFRELLEGINKLQNANQEVEVQYGTCSCADGNVIYSALIIGRLSSTPKRLCNCEVCEKS